MSDRTFPDELLFVVPGEILKAHGHNFQDEIPSGDSLSSANSTVTATDDDDADASSTIVSGKTVSGTSLTAHLAGFANNRNYLIAYKGVMTTSAGAHVKFTLIKRRAQSAAA